MNCQKIITGSYLKYIKSSPHIQNIINSKILHSITENMKPNTRPPISLKPPRIHGSVNREGIDQVRECSLDTVLNHGPLPKFIRVRVP